METGWGCKLHTPRQSLQLLPVCPQGLRIRLVQFLHTCKTVLHPCDESSDLICAIL
ncbi:hypothetical protein BDZ91DRAFT_752501 [Kalaharituber pfeilii]|nr:hypothetical protein BDZ91DRAFT_752501 [Kalaharituber pfeilii]